MKYIIKESQYSRLFEQPDEKLDTQYNKDFMRKNYKPGSLNGLSLDDAVDVISGMIDGIPGIGNLISAGIDVTHALAYGVRFLNSTDDNSKIEMGTLGIITLGAAAIPVEGNALPIAARQGIKEVLRKTPQEILLLGKELGLYKQAVILLSKSKWKYNLLLVLAKICGGELSEMLVNVVKYVRDLIQKISNPDIKKGLQSLNSLLNEFVGDMDSINAAIRISKKLK
jgi:sulfur relay (sulfurtransferase) DsrC/TusE family protein